MLEAFPLQMGSGTYQIWGMEITTGPNTGNGFPFSSMRIVGEKGIAKRKFLRYSFFVPVYSEKGSESMEKGFLHIYCGDGKGKTTAALGLAVRAAGSGYQVVVAQFLKSMPTGEIATLERLGIPVLRVEKTFGFTWELDDRQKEELTREHNRLFRRAAERCAGGRSLLVCDELLDAMQLGLIDAGAVMDWIRHRPDGVELVLTGRQPGEELTEMADYLSEVRKIKHPMDMGVPARRGIEF